MAFNLAALLLLVLPTVCSALSAVRPDYLQQLKTPNAGNPPPALFNSHSPNDELNGGTENRKFFNSKRSKPAFIFYHGGAVMPSVNVYLIYYGNWPQASRSLIEGFITSLGDTNSGSSVAGWWGITTSYFQRVSWVFKRYAGKTITLSGTANDSYSLGMVGLNDTNIQTIVSSHIGVGKFPYDKNAIYLVLTSQNVTVDGFCTQYCGYHSYFNLPTTQQGAIYGLIGDANQCLNGCAAQSVSPNGLPGADGTISIIAHELSEAATDAQPGSGWLTMRGEENADLCAWNFGTGIKAGLDVSGAQYHYNLVDGKGQKYLVQQNWNRALQRCTVQA